jgi:hypothetical protein
MNVRDLIKEEIEYYLKDHEEGDIYEFDYILPIDEIQNILVGLGFEETELEGEETNGWDVDFWYIFVHPEKGKYELTGSLWYGEYTFCKKD